jgi:hypothetical protein
MDMLLFTGLTCIVRLVSFYTNLLIVVLSFAPNPPKIRSPSRGVGLQWVGADRFEPKKECLNRVVTLWNPRDPWVEPPAGILMYYVVAEPPPQLPSSPTVCFPVEPPPPYSLSESIPASLALLRRVPPLPNSNPTARSARILRRQPHP